MDITMDTDIDDSAEPHLESTTDPSERANTIIHELISVLEKLDDAAKLIVDKSALAKLLQLVARSFIQKDIFTDGMSLRAEYKNVDYLATLDSMDFLRQRNILLTSFLNGCINYNYQKLTNKTLLYAIAVSIEMVYYLRNTNLILPHCFLLNLTQMFVSNSKTTSVINGKVSPSAGYTSYKKWIQCQGAVCNKTPKGDIIVFLII